MVVGLVTPCNIVVVACGQLIHSRCKILSEPQSVTPSMDIWAVGEVPFVAIAALLSENLFMCSSYEGFDQPLPEAARSVFAWRQFTYPTVGVVASGRR